MNIEANAVKIQGVWKLQIDVMENGNVNYRLIVPMTPKASIGQLVDLEKVLNAFLVGGNNSDVLDKTGSLLGFFRSLEPELNKKTLGELEEESPDGFQNP